MKAITLWQPWASLCVTRRPGEAIVGPGIRVTQILDPVKTIETRSWPAPKGLIGQRIAIHAAKRVPDHLSEVGEWSVHSAIYVDGGPELRRLGAVVAGELAPDRHARGLAVPLPLGAIVGSAVLADCVPMVGPGEGTPDGWPVEWPFLEVRDDGELILWPCDDAGIADGRDVSDQLPFGHFAPGRWAWLLTDAAPTTERCPWCEGTGVVHKPGVYICQACGGDGRCDPIPASGRQRVWNWRPDGGEG